MFPSETKDDCQIGISGNTKLRETADNKTLQYLDPDSDTLNRLKEYAAVYEFSAADAKSVRC